MFLLIFNLLWTLWLFLKTHNFRIHFLIFNRQQLNIKLNIKQKIYFKLFLDIFYLIHLLSLIGLILYFILLFIGHHLFRKI